MEKTKTNIDVLDKDSWDWVKNRKNKLDLRSISDYIFNMIKEYKKMEIEKIIFLKQLEKFLEYNNYDINELSFHLGLKKEIIIELIEEELGKDYPIYDIAPLERKQRAIKKVHDRMVEFGTIPRELSIAYNINKYIEKNRLDLSRYEKKATDIQDIKIDNKVILSLIYPDKEDLRREIYHACVNLAEWIVSEDNVKDCLECEKDCPLKNPEYIFFSSGIDISKEDYEDDLVSEILRNKFGNNFRVIYGLCLTITINKIIRRNLSQIKRFIEEELDIFKKNNHILIFIKVLVEITNKEFSSWTSKESEQFIKKLSTDYANKFDLVQA